MYVNCILFKQYSFQCIFHCSLHLPNVYVVIYVYVVFMLSPRQHCHQKKIPVWANKSYLILSYLILCMCQMAEVKRT